MNRRDGVLCLSPEAGAYDELHERSSRASVRHRAERRDAAPGALDDRRRARQPRAALRELAVAHTPEIWLDELLSHAHAERVGQVAEQPRQTRRTVDHHVGGADLGRAPRPTRTPMRTACRAAGLGERVRSAANAGRSPASSPANAATAAASRQLGRRRCPCRRGPAGAAPPPSDRGAVHRARARAAVASAQPSPPAPRAGWPRQCTVTATHALALDLQTGQLGLGRRRRARDRSACRADHARRPRPRRRRCAPARRPTYVEAVDRERVEEERHRPTAHHRHAPSSGTSRASASRAARAASRRAGSSTIGASEPSKSTSSAVRAGSSITARAQAGRPRRANRGRRCRRSRDSRRRSHRWVAWTGTAPGSRRRGCRSAATSVPSRSKPGALHHGARRCAAKLSGDTVTPPAPSLSLMACACPFTPDAL